MFNFGGMSVLLTAEPSLQPNYVLNYIQSVFTSLILQQNYQLFRNLFIPVTFSLSVLVSYFSFFLKLGIYFIYISNAIPKVPHTLSHSL